MLGALCTRNSCPCAWLPHALNVPRPPLPVVASTRRHRSPAAQEHGAASTHPASFRTAFGSLPIKGCAAPCSPGTPPDPNAYVLGRGPEAPLCASASWALATWQTDAPALAALPRASISLRSQGARTMCLCAPGGRHPPPSFPNTFRPHHMRATAPAARTTCRLRAVGAIEVARGTISMAPPPGRGRLCHCRLAVTPWIPAACLGSSERPQSCGLAIQLAVMFPNPTLREHPADRLAPFHPARAPS
jgi:hypothetical protein